MEIRIARYVSLLIAINWPRSALIVSGDCYSQSNSGSQSSAEMRRLQVWSTLVRQYSKCKSIISPFQRRLLH